MGARGTAGDGVASGLWGPKDGICTSCRGLAAGESDRSQAGCSTFMSGLAGAQKGHRTGKGRSLEERRDGEASSFPVGAEKLQEEGEDIDNV